MSSQYVDAFRNCASVDMLLTLHHAISSMTDGVFSAEEMLVPAVVVNGASQTVKVCFHGEAILLRRCCWTLLSG
jgi:hypothetical protein